MQSDISQPKILLLCSINIWISHVLNFFFIRNGVSFYYIPVLIVNLSCLTHWSPQLTCPEGTICPIFHQDSSRCPLNIQSNLSVSSLEHDLLPLQLEINLFFQFSAQASVYAVQHIDHLYWRHLLSHLSPRFKLFPATRLGKQKDARDTAAAAAVAAATSDRRGTLAAVGLSLSWAIFAPGVIAMVTRGIKHSWSPTRVCTMNETSSTGRQQNLVSES